jgi:transporter family-2 protein
MGRFGERIGTVEAIAFSTLVTATLSLGALLVARHSLVGYADGFRSPAWLWTAGVMSALIITALTFAAPRIGTTATIAILLAGNLTMAAVIDRFGWFGLDRIPLGWPRLLGLALLAVGAALTLWRR